MTVQSNSKCLSDYPEFLDTQDLVNIGLFSSRKMVHQSMARGLAPDYIRVGRKVLFPKERILAFVQEKLNRVKQHA